MTPSQVKKAVKQIRATLPDGPHRSLRQHEPEDSAKVRSGRRGLRLRGRPDSLRRGRGSEHAHHRGYLTEDGKLDRFVRSTPRRSSSRKHRVRTTTCNTFLLWDRPMCWRSKAAQPGAAHGSVWIADEQTAGRGRSDHSWHSPAGDGLYLSVLLRPTDGPGRCVMALTRHRPRRPVRNLPPLRASQPDIRWPNDLLIGNRKCGGILVETAAIASQLDTTGDAALRRRRCRHQRQSPKLSPRTGNPRYIPAARNRQIVAARTDPHRISSSARERD